MFRGHEKAPKRESSALKPEYMQHGGAMYEIFIDATGKKVAVPVEIPAQPAPLHVTDAQPQSKVSLIEQVQDDEYLTQFIQQSDIQAQAPSVSSHHTYDDNIDRRLAEVRTTRDALDVEVSQLEQKKARHDAQVEQQRQLDEANALAAAAAEVERERQAAAEEAERTRQKQVAEAVLAFHSKRQDHPFTTADVQQLRQLSQPSYGSDADLSVVHETPTVEPEVISASMSVEEWTNSKQAEYIPSADDILRGARVSRRVIEFIKQRPAITGLGALAIVAVAIATPLGMSKLQATPQEIAANISLELPEGGIELASECITADKYDEASSMQLVDGVVPFDLKKPDGTSYKFNDDKGTVRIGNDIVLTGAEVYLGACAADEKESAVSVDGTTITIHRNKVGRQMLVTPSGIEGAIKAQPVNADMAGKLVFNQPENKEKLVGYFAGSTFEALVDSGAAALGEATLKDKAVRAKLDKALDDALVKDLQDDIADIAKRSKVETNKITTELQGEYGQVEMLNVKNDIEGATVITDLVTVKVTKGK